MAGGFGKRSEILDSIKGVILVDSVDDSDGTVCEAIARHRPTYFANGGDRGRTNTPEQNVCEELGVELLWGIFLILSFGRRLVIVNHTYHHN